MERTRSPSAVVGVSWYAATADAYDGPEQHVQRVHRAGFGLVTLVPTYTYADLDQIDFSSTPDFDAQQRAMVAVLQQDKQLVVKPHLDPAIYRPGFDIFTSNNRSWRAGCPWRGFFDVDPMSRDYLERMLLPTLDAVQQALAQVEREGGAQGPAPVRLDIGSELMNSTVHRPDRWAQLLSRMRREVARRGLEGRVLLSHNFSHHFLIADDFVGRMDEAARRALGEYIGGLDGLAISQYMDLTVEVPEDERGERLPTAEEVADALVRHEQQLRSDILQRQLGLSPGGIPPLHIGEFGIGRGGLARPSLWQGDLPAELERTLATHIAIGHRGFAEYLKRSTGRTAHSGVLWVTGPPYDIFGWYDPEAELPPAQKAYDWLREER